MTRKKAPWPMMTTPEETGIQNAPSFLGYIMGRELARLTAPEWARRPDMPQPCEDCAFREGTTPNKCAGTVSDALKCVIERRAFHCHHREGAPLCAGFLAALRATETEP